MARRSQKNESRERGKREVEKSASKTSSIVDMFSTQTKKNNSQDKSPLPALPQAILSPKIPGEKVVKTQHKSLTQVVQDLGQLLHIKTVQKNR